MLNCSSTADDSIEHYFSCPTWRRWLRDRLGQGVADHALQHGVLAHRMLDNDLSRQAVATYVLYRTVHHMRRLTGHAAASYETYLRHYMDQQLHEAVRDDKRLRHCCRSARQEAYTKRPLTEDTAVAARSVRPRTTTANSSIPSTCPAPSSV